MNPEKNDRKIADPTHRRESSDATAPVSRRACEALQTNLKAYVDGQVGWWQRQTIRRHVARCAACREEMEAMREFSDRVLRWERTEAEGKDAEVLDPALRARILAAVPNTPPPMPASKARLHRPRPMVLTGATASVVVVCLAARGLYLLWGSNMSPTLQGDVYSTSKAVSSSGPKMEGAASVPPTMPASEDKIASKDLSTRKAVGMVSAKPQEYVDRSVPTGSATYKPAAPSAPGSVEAANDQAGRTSAGSSPAGGSFGSHTKSAPQSGITGGFTKNSVPERAPGNTSLNNPAADFDRSAVAVNGTAQAARTSPEASKARKTTETSARPEEKATGTLNTHMANNAYAVQKQQNANQNGLLDSAVRAPHGSSRKTENVPTLLNRTPLNKTTQTEITVQVADLEAGMTSLEESARQRGGSVVLSALTTREDRSRTATLTLKIPPAEQKAFLEHAARLGVVKPDLPTNTDTPPNLLESAGNSQPTSTRRARRKAGAPIDVTIHLIKPAP